MLFRSPVAGVFTSHFELQLNPPLPDAPPPALALRGVSCAIEPRSKVGIAGRTG